VSEAEDRSTEAEVIEMLGAVDPVPPDVVEAAKAAFAWRGAGEEIAALVAEAEAGEGVALVRGGTREVAFRTAAAEIVVEVAAGGRTSRLTGQVVPPLPGTVTGEWPGGSVAGEVDERGRFVLEGVRSGLVRLRFAPAAGPEIVTDWLRA
jgi:hypothetical protein